MGKNLKRFLTMALVALLAVCMMSVNVLAAEEDATYEAKIDDTEYETLEAAVEAANATTGATIELLADVTLSGGFAKDSEAGLYIASSVTINGNEHTINCGTYTKGIRVYGNAGTGVKINDVTIVNDNPNGRCIDTRVDNITLRMDGVHLVAINGNSQPLTIGGQNTNPKKPVTVNMKRGSIDAGAAGYGVIAFVPTSLTFSAGNDATGYAAVYMKDGSNGSIITVGSDVVLTGNNCYAGEHNAFGTVVFECSGHELNIQNGAKIVANATGTAQQSAIDMNGYEITVSEPSGTLVANGDSAVYLDDMEISTVLVTENTKATLVDAGYAVSTEYEDAANKQYLVYGYGVARIGDTYYKTLAEAVAAANASEADNVIELLCDITLTETVTLTGWSDDIKSISGEKFTITYTGSGAAIELAGQDSKISSVNIDVSGAEKGTAAIKISNGHAGHTHGYTFGTITAGDNVAFYFTGNAAMPLYLAENTINAATFIISDAADARVSEGNNTINCVAAEDSFAAIMINDGKLTVSQAHYKENITVNGQHVVYVSTSALANYEEGTFDFEAQAGILDEDKLAHLTLNKEDGYLKYVTSEAKVVEQNGTTTYYYSVEQAVAYANQGNDRRIYLLRDVVIEDTLTVIHYGNSIDGQGHSLTYAGEGAAIEFAGTMTNISNITLNITNRDGKGIALLYSNGNSNGFGAPKVTIEAGNNTAIKLTDKATFVKMYDGTINAATLVVSDATNAVLHIGNNPVTGNANISVQGGKLTLAELFNNFPLNSKEIKVAANATLDINGVDVTAGNVVADGNVIDSTDGHGSITIAENGALEFKNHANANYLPIYDTDNGCYRMYNTTLKNRGARASGTDAVKFGFTIQFTNKDAYLLLAKSIDEGLLSASFSWNNLEQPLTYVFSNAGIKEFAEAAYSQMDGGKTSVTSVITVKITGISALEDGTVLSGIPTLNTATGVVITGAEKTYTVGG